MTPSLCHYTYIPMPCTDFSSYFLFIYLSITFFSAFPHTHKPVSSLDSIYFTIVIPFPCSLQNHIYMNIMHGTYSCYMYQIYPFSIETYEIWERKKYISLHLLFALVCIFRMDLFFFSLADGHAHIIWVICTLYGCKYNI